MHMDMDMDMHMHMDMVHGTWYMVHIHVAHSVDAQCEGSDPKDPETPVRPVLFHVSVRVPGRRPGLSFWDWFSGAWLVTSI